MAIPTSPVLGLKVSTPPFLRKPSQKSNQPLHMCLHLPPDPCLYLPVSKLFCFRCVTGFKTPNFRHSHSGRTCTDLLGESLSILFLFAIFCQDIGHTTIQWFGVYVKVEYRAGPQASCPLLETCSYA